MRWTCIASVLTVGLGAGALAAEALPKPPFVAEVTGESVYIRAGDGINYTVLAVAEKGDRFEVKGERFGWLRVAVPETCTLWVSNKLLTPDADGKQAVVVGDRVNIRARANPKADVMGQLARGARVSLVDEDGEWRGIAPPDAVSAWVHSRFVRKATGPAAKRPPDEKAGPEAASGAATALLKKAQELFAAELAKAPDQRDFGGALAAYQRVAATCKGTAAASRAEQARQRLLKIVDLHEALKGARQSLDQFDTKYKNLEAEYRRRAEEADQRDPK